MSQWHPLPTQTCQLTESPRFLGDRWIWVDIHQPRLFEFNGDSILEAKPHQITVTPLPDEIGCVLPTTKIGTYCGLGRKGLWTLSPHHPTLKQAAPFDNQTHRYNDGRADAKGRIWISSLVDARTPATAALYCIHNGAISQHVDQLIVGNGLAFSPCNRYMFLSDSRHKCIWRYDFNLEQGTLSHKELVHQYSTGTERPDGATVTEDGSYWVGILEGYRLDRYSINGKLLEEIELPLAKPTMPCFGGPNRSELLVTSAQASTAIPNHAGFEHTSVIACKTQYTGLKENLAL